MKAMAIAVVLLASSAALAQDYGTTPSAPTPSTPTTTETMPDVSTPDMTTPSTTTTTDTWSATQTSAAPAPASAQVVQPSNADPQHDARGIAVISLPAVVPPGFNGLPAGGTGGPLLDPATGEAIAGAEVPPCSAEVTDRCLQTYERGRARD